MHLLEWFDLNVGYNNVSNDKLRRSSYCYVHLAKTLTKTCRIENIGIVQ